MKGPSEQKFRKALLEAVPGVVVYKPPDDARNWKPCDFMAWWQSSDQEGLPALRSAWFEVKEAKAGMSLPASDLRPSQRAGIHDASRIGLPYYLAIWWKARGVWTISAAWLLGPIPTRGSINFTTLAGGIGIDSPPRALPSVIAAVLRGDVL